MVSHCRVNILLFLETFLIWLERVMGKRLANIWYSENLTFGIYDKWATCFGFCFWIVFVLFLFQRKNYRSVKTP